MENQETATPEYIIRTYQGTPTRWSMEWLEMGVPNGRYITFFEDGTVYASSYTDGGYCFMESEDMRSTVSREKFEAMHSLYSVVA